jgi:hypothetical protein
MALASPLLGAPASAVTMRKWLFSTLFVVLIASRGYATPLFMGLGDLPGGAFLSRADGVSADGSTAVGVSGARFRSDQASAGLLVGNEVLALGLAFHRLEQLCLSYLFQEESVNAMLNCDWGCAGCDLGGAERRAGQQDSHL